MPAPIQPHTSILSLASLKVLASRSSSQAGPHVAWKFQVRLQSPVSSQQCPPNQLALTQSSVLVHVLCRNTFRPKKNTPVGAKVGWSAHTRAQQHRGSSAVAAGTPSLTCHPLLLPCNTGPSTQASHRCHPRAGQLDRGGTVAARGRHQGVAGGQHGGLLQRHLGPVQHTGRVLHRQQLRGHVSRQQGGQAACARVGAVGRVQGSVAPAAGRQQEGLPRQASDTAQRSVGMQQQLAGDAQPA